MRRCAYGTRDAGILWEETYRERLTDLGFKRGIASPCVFWHRERNLRVVVHADEFTILGCRAEIRWLQNALAETFEIKLRGIIGESADCLNDITILNRVLNSHLMA